MFPQKLISFLAVTIMLVVTYLAMSTFGVQLGAPIVMSLPVMLFLVISPRRALLFAWACLSLLPYMFKEYLGSSAYHVLNEGVVVLLWLAWVAKIMLDGKIGEIPATLKRLGILIFVVSAVSMLFNKVNPAYWGEWVITYMLPFPVLAISRTYLKDYSPARLLRIIIIFLLIQFVLNMGWHMGINPLRNYSSIVDLSCGTYGNTAATGYITLAAVVGGMCYWVSSARNFGSRLRAMLLILLAVIQFVFTYTIHAYLLVPIGLLVFVYFFPRAKGRGAGKVIYVLLVVSLAFLTIVPLLSKTSTRANSRHGVYSSEYGKKVWQSVWHGPKVDVIRKVVKKASPAQLVIGMGPNSAVSYTGLLLNSPRTISLIGDWYYTYSGRREMSTGSIRENLFSGTVMLFSEIGLMGLVLYLFLLVYPLIYIARYVRRDNTISAEMRFLIGFVVMLLITNLAIGIVWDVWRIRMMTTGIWLLLGRVMGNQEDTEDLLKPADDTKKALR